LKDLLIVLVANLASIFFAFFAGLTIYKDGYRDGVGWLIFASLLCTSNGIKFK